MGSESSDAMKNSSFWHRRQRQSDDLIVWWMGHLKYCLGWKSTATVAVLAIVPTLLNMFNNFKV